MLDQKKKRNVLKMVTKKEATRDGFGKGLVEAGKSNKNKYGTF